MSLDRDTAVELAKVLNALAEFNDIKKIADTFIPAFKSAEPRDGHYYLHGNFTVGGTKSGRMSSSSPNLQNIPSTGSKYAKAVKECIKPPEGYLLVGADFNALEARIGALLTKDPEKLKIYTQGFDSHCANTYTYWQERMPDIDGTSVESINSIEDKYPDYRQLSKTVTFALQYLGTEFTLVKNSGFTLEEAKKIVTRYNERYAVSKEWGNKLLTNALIANYVELAFGLKLRTKHINNTILHNRLTPYSAEAESRTLVNAAQQSYGLLNNRAHFAFMERVYASEFAKDIQPVAQIHDSGYYIVKDDPVVVKFVNDNLIPEMQWQELEPIKHPEVHLGGVLELYYPNWSMKNKIPNGASLEEIEQIIKKAKEVV